MSSVRSWKLLVFAAVFASIVAACSSSKSTSSPTTAPAGTTGASSKVSGTPYKLMYAQSIGDQATSYIPAIEQGVNSRGGIAGHPLQIVVCTDNNDANQATQCGRQAASDPSILGVIGNSSTCSSQLLPILQQAKMASIGDQFFCPEDFKSPVVFPFNGGTIASAAALAGSIKYFHNPTIDVATLQSPASGELPVLLKGAVTPAGGKIGTSVFVPLTSADMAPYAQQLASSHGVLYEAMDVAVGVRLGKALQQIGYNNPIIYNANVWYPSVIQSNFGNPTNAYIFEYYNLASSGYRQFLADMGKYGPGTTYQAADLVNLWLSANVVAEIAKDLPTVSASSVLSYLSKATNLNTFGMTGPLNFTVPQADFGGLTPRDANPNVAMYHYVDGNLVQVTPF